ncbi:hypothetical protein Llan_0688, partial [Legionella lansingensis]
YSEATTQYIFCPSATGSIEATGGGTDCVLQFLTKVRNVREKNCPNQMKLT